MTDIKFLVPGVPVPKSRIPTNGGKFAFTPKKTVAYEGLVRHSYSEKYPDVEPTSDLVELFVTFAFPIPAGAKRKRGPDKIVPGDRHAIRPDLDNLIKSVLDGLNQVAFVDDKQVVGIHAIKIYGKVPGAIVSLRPATGGKTND